MNKIYKSIASVIAIICLSLAIWSCENNVAPTIETTTLKGVLADKQGNTIPFAIVNIYDVSSGKTVIQTDKLLAKDTTDEDGNYEVKNIPTDFENLTLEAEHSDFTKFQIKLKDVKSSIKDNKLQSKMENKDECGFKLNFTILDSNSQQAIPGAQVRLNRDGKLIRKTITNDQGNINFEGVCPGKYEFRLAREGYNTIESTVTIGGSDSVTNLPLLMKRLNETPPDTCCDGILKLFIKDKDGKYIVGAKFKLVQNGKTIKDGSITSDNEPVTLDKLCEGKYRLLITAEGFKEIEMDVTVSCKEPVNVSKVMEKPSTDTCCDGIAKIFVKDKDGKYIVGAKYKLYLNGKLIKDGSITSDSEPLTLDKLCEGKYSISINADGYNGVETNLTVACKEPVSVSKILEKKAADSCCNAVAKFFVKDSTGKYIVGATVRIYKNGKIIKELKVTSDNEPLSFTDLCEGAYSFDITAESFKGVEGTFIASCKEPVSTSKILVKNPCCDGIANIIVKDSTGKLIPNAKIKLVLSGKVIKEATTNGVDGVSLLGLCEGNYRLLITVDGYKGSESDLVISCKEPANVMKILTKLTDSCCDGIVKVYAKDASGKMLLGATVKLMFNGQIIKTTVTNGTEPVIFTNLCQGPYKVFITYDGYVAVEAEIQVSCAEPNTLIKILESNKKDSCCDGVAKFFIKNGEGKYIVGATVKLMQNGKVIKEVKVTSDNEPLTFTGLCEGTYSVIVSAEGYKAADGSVVVSCKEPVNVTKTLVKNVCCDGIAKISVKDSTGKYIVGAKIKIYQGSTLLKEVTTTSSTEPYTFTGLCEGTNYSVSISADGYKGVEAAFTVSCAEAANVAKTLVKNACCDGIAKFFVKDVNNAYIIGAKVKLYQNGVLIKEGTVTQNNEPLTLSSLCEGNYSVAITADGYNGVETNVSVSCGTPANVSKTLTKKPADSCCTSTLKFRVMDKSNSQLISGATVKIMIDNTVIESGTTNGDGVWTSSQLCNKTYKIVITASGYIDLTTTWVVPTPCGALQETFKLDK